MGVLNHHGSALSEALMLCLQRAPGTILVLILVLLLLLFLIITKPFLTVSQWSTPQKVADADEYVYV